MERQLHDRVLPRWTELRPGQVPASDHSIATYRSSPSTQPSQTNDQSSYWLPGLMAPSRNTAGQAGRGSTTGAPLAGKAEACGRAMTAATSPQTAANDNHAPGTARFPVT